MRRLLATAAIAASLTLAACGGDDGDEPAPASASPAANESEPAKDGEPAKSGTEITVGPSQFGEVLFDGSKQAIYLFDKESTSKPECYGECAAAWPPVLTQGEPVAAGDADETLLGTTTRDDGATQVTYAGQPVYYYAHEGPGQVLCHNVAEFGGLWLVLDASGRAL